MSDVIRSARSRSYGALGYWIYVYATLFIVGGIVFFPLLATAMGGLKTLGELRTNPFGLPAQWDFSNYWSILTGPDYWRMMGNSLAIAGITVFLTLVLGSMTAFAFAHVKFFGREALFNFFLLGLLFPGATAILPLFLRIRDLGLLDSYFGVALPQVAFGLSMSILLFRRFFLEVPAELYEAAKIDGAGYARSFFWITLPLSRPILSTVAILTFVGSWNGYLLPLIMLNQTALFPWPLGVMTFMSEYSADWQKILAYLTLTILPTVITFAFAQKYIVAGLTAGAVKG
jgi:raffinose/stachyose/melibiose transport system permease protein